jgi:hypothetical protein
LFGSRKEGKKEKGINEKSRKIKRISESKKSRDGAKEKEIRKEEASEKRQVGGTTWGMSKEEFGKGQEGGKEED